MTELQRYLAEEVAEDHADGIITRREAVRRLGLLGVSGSAAVALLGTAVSDAATKPKPKAKRRKAPATTGTARDWGPVASTPITFAGPRGTLMGAWAPAAGKAKGAVLVIHENRGLTDHIRNVAGRYAASGYSALALDLLSEEGGTASFPGEAEVGAALSAAPPERFDADMKAAVGELRRRVPRKGIAATGFCFGGGMMWRLLVAGDGARRRGAVLGPLPEGGKVLSPTPRSRRLCRPRHARQRVPRRGRAALKAAPSPTASHAHAGRPYVLQRTGMRFDAPRRGGLAPGADLVRTHLR